MQVGHAFYQSVNITCVCLMSQNTTDIPAEGLYVEKDFPFLTTCARPAIIDPGRAHQKRPARYYTVSIQDCEPPEDVSYATALAAFGIHVISDFSINITKSARLSAASFSDLSPLLERIWLVVSGKLVLLPGAIAGLSTVAFLQLSQVEADHLPPYLEGLELKNTSYEELPSEALHAAEIVIEDKTLKTISGEVQHLRSLTLDTPALESVSLEYALVEVLRGAWRGSPALRRLRLRWLRGVGPSLPEDLFSSSPGLTDIEISETKELQVLPEGLFAGLPNLKNLTLKNNQLSASGLVSLMKVTALTKLELSGNPLGDLCTDGGESGMQQLSALQHLGLARTNATRVCADWPRAANTLRAVDLSDNAISSVACAELIAQGDERPYINLNGNSLEKANCSRKDYNRTVADRTTVKVLYRWTDPQLPCHCDVYWLWRLARESNDTAIFTQADKQAKCVPLWRRCHPEDDAKFIIDYEEGEWYRTSCEQVALDDFERPGLPSLTVFKYVTLIGCVPIAKQSYLKSLLALKIIITTELSLIDVPADAGFTTEWIDDLPLSLREFKLHAVVRSNPTRLQRFHSLNLTRLPVGLLPPNLTRVQLMGTGIKTLHADVFKTVESLHIEEDDLTSFNGTLPQLTRMRLTAPLEDLPEAPKLQFLVLCEVVPEPLSGYSALIDLEMYRLHLPMLPYKLLEDSSLLVNFIVNDNFFVMLPTDLFAYSPNLEMIDLSDNGIQALPPGLFARLKKLKTLILRDNLLTVRYLDALSQVTSLNVLDLSKNRIEEFCHEGQSLLWRLTELKNLNLSQSMIKSICSDWLNMRQLSSLDLSGNYIDSLRCSDLRARRDVPAEIRLENNTFHSITCSWRDHEETVHSQPPKLRVQVKTNTRLSCSCDRYWLSRVMRELSVAFNLTATFGSPCQSNMAHRCRARTQCPCARKGCYSFMNTEDEDIYKIDDMWLTLRYDEGHSFSISCSEKVTLDHPALPVFSRMVHFTTVTLRGCAPPQKTYKRISEVLLSLNITIGHNLYLYDIPSNAIFTASSLESLPTLKVLHLEAAEYLVIPKGVLGHVTPIISLTLVRVHSEEMPQYLAHLNLTETGFEELQPGALEAQELTVVEKKQTSLSGYSAELRKLSVTAPVTSLVDAPNLKVLELTGTEPAAGFLDGYPVLHTLRLRQLPLQLLPDKFLRNATQLRHFKLTDSNVTSLPADLFSYSPNLETIDLSNNQLQVLRRDQFVGLVKLKSLNVEKNRLGVVNPGDFTSLLSLKKFKY